MQATAQPSFGDSDHRLGARRAACQVFVGLIMLYAPIGLWAAPVAAELMRPAIVVAHPEQAVLLGIASAGKRLISVGERGLIIVSDDAGHTWRQVPAPVSVTLTAVHFINARSGWVVGHQGVVLHSDDGGESWRLQLEGYQVAQLALAAAQSAVSNTDKQSGDRQLAEARRLVDEGADKPFFDVHFQNERTGWVIGAYGLCFQTTDGGQTWQPWMTHLDNPGSLHLYTIAGADQVVYVAGEQGLFLRSDDAGLTFHVIETPYQGSFFTLTIGAPTELILGGMNGHAYRSDDGGSSWRALASTGGGSWVASASLTGNRNILVDQFGQLMMNHPPDNVLQRVPAVPTFLVAAVASVGNGDLVGAGLRGISRIRLRSIVEAL